MSPLAIILCVLAGLAGLAVIGLAIVAAILDCHLEVMDRGVFPPGTGASQKLGGR